MSRQPKPFFRQQTQSWYFSTGGKQYPLGKDREAAIQKFHQLMASTQQLPAEVITVNDLAQKYLDWCRTNRAESTYKNHVRYFKSFIVANGDHGWMYPTLRHQGNQTQHSLASAESGSLERGVAKEYCDNYLGTAVYRLLAVNTSGVLGLFKPTIGEWQTQPPNV